MKAADSRALTAALAATAKSPCCYLCSGPTAGVSVLTFPLPNGKQRFCLSPMCRQCIADAQDPIGGARVRAEVERRVIAEIGDGYGR